MLRRLQESANSSVLDVQHLNVQHSSEEGVVSNALVDPKNYIDQSKFFNLIQDEGGFSVKLIVTNLIHSLQ